MNHVEEDIIAFLRVSVSPQKLIDTKRQLVPVGKPVQFHVSLHATPICLYGIRACACYGIYEVFRVIHRLMMITHVRQLPVSGLFVTEYRAASPHKLVDGGNERYDCASSTSSMCPSFVWVSYKPKTHC